MYHEHKKLSRRRCEFGLFFAKSCSKLKTATEQDNWKKKDHYEIGDLRKANRQNQDHQEIGGKLNTMETDLNVKSIEK